MTVTVTGPELHQALRNWASGLHTDRAALELLIEHDMWLNRRDFVANHVHWVPKEQLALPDEPLAMIEWSEAAAALDAGDLIASSSQAAILRIALSLVGVRSVDLREALSGLGWASVGPVCGAMAAAAGAERQVLITVAPTPRPDFLTE
ncbi:hypothetical protein [Nocardiopsis sp. NRRL B-16309]|uniref:hypothetical protein n=1 Tax=Nocardiopsis sp. NRRL B-16309 TaxID=1519494 RepID=UPI0006AF8F04|nr:hypothetical protein [Nocardiopsis sp. NRRL B-16309]KOX11834.1 hypothetical protein ADL05_23010 [Nocardiopsis sp. NRRL B-16309]